MENVEDQTQRSDSLERDNVTEITLTSAVTDVISIMIFISLLLVICLSIHDYAPGPDDSL